jgi:flagellar biosynthesis protein FlhA
MGESTTAAAPGGMGVLGRILRQSDLMVAIGIVVIVIMMIVPIPHMLLDLFITLNIATALTVVLISVYARRALDFSAFPTLLLITTLFRLAINISVTRLILLEGDAGKVVETFGGFVIGGSIVVGLVVFFILMVVQFVVITNGAGRVAEVAARFTLDAMPGKQMAIDADLNAGLIDDAEARRRRLDVAAEADFYGAMDGASKFVKGDAIAAIVITVVNLVGGLIVGVVQRHESVGQAVQHYSLLSIGDGLVSQIPALLISISTGLIVTRATTHNDMGSDLMSQFGRQRQAVQVAGAAMIVLGLVPGLPKLPFLVLGGLVLFVGNRLPKPEVEPEVVADADQPAPDAPESIARDMRVEPLELELAYDLIDLVDPSAGGDLLDRVRALRRKVALELGLVMPFVRTRDNLDLPPHTYAIRMHGVEVGRGEAPPATVLAIGDDLGALPGTPTQEPVFGLAAKWVPIELRQQAELARNHAATLLGREDVKLLVDMVKASHPAVVEELTPALLNLGDIQRVLQSLLSERVSIRDLVRIFEALSQRARVSTDPDGLVEASRAVLGGAISAAYAVDGRLPVITFEPLLEQTLLENLRGGESGSFLAVDPSYAEAIALQVQSTAERAEQRGEQPVLVCAQPLRPAIRKLVKQVAPSLPVLSYGELGGSLRLATIGVVDVASAAAAA